MSTQLWETGRSVSTPSNLKTQCSVWCKKKKKTSMHLLFLYIVLSRVEDFIFMSFSLSSDLHPCNCRHVKGRVLVALADGTLAIFHRSEGNRTLTETPDVSLLGEVMIAGGIGALPPVQCACTVKIKDRESSR